MQFFSFFSILPEIAKLETRSATILNDPNVPDGEYAFLELHCADNTCDCRHLFINVTQVHPEHDPRHVATISYGWESMSFYRNWGRSLSDEMLKEFKGPSLDRYQKQSPHAEYFLDFFKKMIASDAAYANRLKAHYKLFKWKTGMKLPKNLAFDPDMRCPCGSEAKFKSCCGRKVPKP